MNRFPYSIVYFEWQGHDTVVVLAIFHQARDPRVWKGRLSDLEDRLRD